MTHKHDILIITPTYNEKDNVENHIGGVFSHLPEADMLIVDDASPDGTGDLAEKISQNDKRVRVMHRSGKLGLGTAYVAGFKKAIEEGYSTVFEMDADLSHDPQYLPDFIRALDEGADIVLGSRSVEGGGVSGWGPLRHVISKGGSIYSRLVLGMGVRDLTTGYKGIRTSVFEKLDLDSIEAQGFGFQVEFNYRAFLSGCSIVEVPIIFEDRRAGESKMSGNIFFEAALLVMKLRMKHIRGEI